MVDGVKILLLGIVVGLLFGVVGLLSDIRDSSRFRASMAPSTQSLGIIELGTMQNAGANWIQLRAAATYLDDELIGATIVTMDGQARLITDQFGDYVVFGASWTNPPATEYIIYATWLPR